MFFFSLLSKISPADCNYYKCISLQQIHRVAHCLFRDCWQFVHLSIYGFLFMLCDRFTVYYFVSLLQLGSPKENAELSWIKKK